MTSVAAALFFTNPAGSVPYPSTRLNVESVMNRPDVELHATLYGALSCVALGLPGLLALFAWLWPIANGALNVRVRADLARQEIGLAELPVCVRSRHEERRRRSWNGRVRRGCTRIGDCRARHGDVDRLIIARVERHRRAGPGEDCNRRRR